MGVCGEERQRKIEESKMEEYLRNREELRKEQERKKIEEQHSFKVRIIYNYKKCPVSI